MSVYKAISEVQKELASHGIGKNQTNSFDKYKFRGIDDIYNALAPAMAKHGLCVLPRCLSRDCQERTSADGSKAMFYVTVDVEYDFVAAEDGSKHTVRVFGEAMDRSDKATNKAMSAAYKYACLQTFCIPTEGDNDADKSTPEVLPADPYTPEQRQIFHDAILTGDAMLLVALMGTCSEEAQTGLHNSFDSGAKSSGKVKVRELTTQGIEQWTQLIADIHAMLDAQDGYGLKEAVSELSKIERAYLHRRLGDKTSQMVGDTIRATQEAA